MAEVVNLLPVPDSQSTNTASRGNRRRHRRGGRGASVASHQHGESQDIGGVAVQIDNLAISDQGEMGSSSSGAEGYVNNSRPQTSSVDPRIRRKQSPRRDRPSNNGISNGGNIISATSVASTSTLATTDGPAPRRNRQRNKRGGGLTQSEAQQDGEHHHIHQNSSTRGSRGGRSRGGTYIPPTRTFGGQLTTNNDDEEETSISIPLRKSNTKPGPSQAFLRGEASDFEPGRQHTIAGPSNQPIVIQSGIAAKNEQDLKSRTREPKKPKTIKEAEDLMTRIHDGISSGNYECMICYGGVTRRGKVWDCRRCYAVFHMNCIQKWAKQALEQTGPQNEEIAQRRTWRCPGCQNASEETPRTYTCWCKKTESPEMARYIPPHR